MTLHRHPDPLDDETRGLIDAPGGHGRVKKVATGTSGTCVPRWKDHSKPKRGRPEVVANRRLIAPLLAAGKRLSEIARETGIAYETVRRVVAALRGASQAGFDSGAQSETSEASCRSNGPLSGSEMGDISCRHVGLDAEKEIGL